MMYLLQRIKDSRDWPKGCTIWAEQPCKGWRVIGKCYDSGANRRQYRKEWK